MKTLAIVLLLNMGWMQLAGGDKKDNPSKDTALPVKEKTSLEFMREEEKLAYDVYVILYEKWGLMPFNNISYSEATHMAAIKTLLDRYNIKDPAQSSSGQFTNPKLQELYNQLLQKGNLSISDALLTGAAIEEIDIRDLKEQLQFVTHTDIQQVYENLMRGSRNHLRAFVRNLSNRGVNYKPQYLSQQEFDAIINSPQEQGGMR